ncbi:MAG: hypothetical protein IIA41_14180 [SAR324 cluster bacterium]|nr:hypothetical protein [SAR324 cluster bacterium]
MILIARIITDLDHADAGGGETRVFVIKHVDVNEIIPVLRHLIGGFLGQELKAVTVAGGAPAAGPIAAPLDPPGSCPASLYLIAMALGGDPTPPRTLSGLEVNMAR